MGPIVTHVLSHSRVTHVPITQAPITQTLILQNPITGDSIIRVLLICSLITRTLYHTGHHDHHTGPLSHRTPIRESPYHSDPNQNLLSYGPLSHRPHHTDPYHQEPLSQKPQLHGLGYPFYTGPLSHSPLVTPVPIRRSPIALHLSTNRN